MSSVIYSTIFNDFVGIILLKHTWTIKRTSLVSLLKMGQSRPLFCLFSSFPHYTIQ